MLRFAKAVAALKYGFGEAGNSLVMHCGSLHGDAFPFVSPSEEVCGRNRGISRAVWSIAWAPIFGAASYFVDSAMEWV